VRIERRFAEVEPADGDPARLVQVCTNLIRNAFESLRDVAADRVPTVTLSLRTDGPDRVAAEVADNGPGIPPETLESVFDPFFSTKPGGTGLGLAVAHSIVRRHGGEISATSVPGAGATFRLRLPAGDPVLVATDPPAPVLRGSGRVLIMDDDPAVRRSLGRMLSELGYRASTARNGEEAVALYREAIARAERFDAVLMDLRVTKGTGGRDALRALADLDPEVRAVAVSGYSEDAGLAGHQDLGFRACLAKPFTPDDLARVLHGVMAVPARVPAE
jgi:CheY-like chemotaxis protein